MKTTTLLSTFFLMVFVLTTNAQEFKLGKVSMAELKEKVHPKDSTATAAVLYEKGKTFFEYKQDYGFQLCTEVEVRIKMYKKEGFEYGNKMISYYTGSSYNESVRFANAVTYNLVNGNIEETKLKSEGEFVEKVNENWERKKITMPNLKEGSVIEYKYVIKSPYVSTFPEWNFQATIPINYTEYTTNIPEYYNYKVYKKGYLIPKEVKKQLYQSIVLNTKIAGAMVGQRQPMFSAETIKYTDNQVVYSLENVPAIKLEAYVNSLNNYTTSLQHELSSKKMPNSLPEFFSESWEDVVKVIYESDNFGTELKKESFFEGDIDKLLVGIPTKEERIIAIFDYVKNNIKWDGSEGIYCAKGVKKAYQERVGNVAEINLILTAMLRHAGYDANPVLVSTRSNGIALFPSRAAFNYIIAAVVFENDLMLLDATEKYSMPNVLPFRDLNWLGRLIRKDGTSVAVDLTPKAVSKENTNMNLVLSSDGVVEGKIRRQLDNHEALYFRQKNLLTNKDSYLESLENENNNIEINDYVRDFELNLSKPIMETYSFKSSKAVEIINGKIYISPMLFLATKENPFKQEVREYPIDFGYPTESTYSINLEIPDGYAVESLPKTMNIATGENVGAFKYNIINQGNRIRVSITGSINEVVVPSDFYQSLKDFFQQMIDKENEKIVLVKV